jgi:hypothetical protein
MRLQMPSNDASASCSPRSRAAGAAVSRRRAAPLLALLGLTTAGLLGGCGSGEHKFTPEGFVEAINAEGAGVALGPTITTTPSGIEVHEVTLTAALTDVGSPVTDTSRSDNGSGSLLIAGDADAARDEFERCDSVEELTCFRAANAVLRFEEMDGADQARIVTSLEAIETEGG